MERWVTHTRFATTLCRMSPELPAMGKRLSHTASRMTTNTPFSTLNPALPWHIEPLIEL
jgi:hypothetical protein